jgi:hypothetical protein
VVAGASDKTKESARKAVDPWLRETPTLTKTNTDLLWRISAEGASLAAFATMARAICDPFRRCRCCQKPRQFSPLAARKESTVLRANNNAERVIIESVA